MKRITITSSSSLPSLKVGGIPWCLAANSSIKLCVAWSLYKHIKGEATMQCSGYHSIYCRAHWAWIWSFYWQILFFWKCLSASPPSAPPQRKVNSKKVLNHNDMNFLQLKKYFPAVMAMYWAEYRVNRYTFLLYMQ